jgi:hypothetical protein
LLVAFIWVRLRAVAYTCPRSEIGAVT